MGRENYYKVKNFQQMVDDYKLESPKMNDILYGEGNPHGVPTENVHGFSVGRTAFKTFALGAMLSRGANLDEILFTERIENPERAQQVKQLKNQVAAEMGQHFGKETLDDDDKKWLADFTLKGRAAVMNAVDKMYSGTPGKNINEFLGIKGVYAKVFGTACKDYFQEMDREPQNFIFTEEQAEEYERDNSTVNSMSSSSRFVAESMEALTLIYEPPVSDTLENERDIEFQQMSDISKGVGEFWRGNYIFNLWGEYKNAHPKANMSDFCREFASESVTAVPVQEVLLDNPENGISAAEYLHNNREKRYMLADAFLEGGLARNFEVESMDIVAGNVAGHDVIGKIVSSVNLKLEGKNLLSAEGLRNVRSTDFEKAEGPSEGAYFQTTKYLPDNIVVKTNKRQLATVGGSLSTRIPLKFTDERGNSVLGFFTENTYVGESKSEQNNYYQKKHVKQKTGRNINVRNNMMYEYSRLLGMGNLVAKSFNMTIETLDGPVNGTFMKQADGLTFSQLPKSGDKIRFTGEAKKQVSNMQILDYLSGNVDRHIGNMLYKTEMGKDGKLYITGVMGIDDDASFGKVKSNDSHYGQKVRGRMSTLDDIKIIDRELADSILKMDKRELRKILHMGNVSHEEFKDAMERFDSLKTKIEKGKVQIIDGDKAWKQYNVGPLCQPVEQVAYSHNGEGFTIKTSNIWTVMGSVQKSYNKSKLDRKSSNEEIKKNYDLAVKKAQEAAEEKSLVFSDNMSLNGHISSQADHLKEIDDSFVETDISKNSEEFNLMYAGLKGLQRYCRNMESRDFDEQPYTDKELNDLATLFDTTRNLANNYILEKGNPITDRGKERLALAKNLSVYCNEMKHKAFENMREAEMISITKQASEIAKTMIKTKAAASNKIAASNKAAVSNKVEGPQAEERLIDEDAVQQDQQNQQKQQNEKAKASVPGLG